MWHSILVNGSRGFFFGSTWGLRQEVSFIQSSLLLLWSHLVECHHSSGREHLSGFTVGTDAIDQLVISHLFSVDKKLNLFMERVQSSFNS